MENLDGMTPELARVFAAKEERRKALARLPFPAKVEAVIKLQQMAAPILRTRGKVAQPWTISATSEKSPNASTPTNPGESI
jgi:hypothetical protein